MEKYNIIQIPIILSFHIFENLLPRTKLIGVLAIMRVSVGTRRRSEPTNDGALSTAVAYRMSEGRSRSFAY